jgi:hypothetical protein
MLLIPVTRYGYRNPVNFPTLIWTIQGPVIAYLKKVGDATTDVGYGIPTPRSFEGNQKLIFARRRMVQNL